MNYLSLGVTMMQNIAKIITRSYLKCLKGLGHRLTIKIKKYNLNWKLLKHNLKIFEHT